MKAVQNQVPDGTYCSSDGTTAVTIRNGNVVSRCTNMSKKEFSLFIEGRTIFVADEIVDMYCSMSPMIPSTLTVN